MTTAAVGFAFPRKAEKGCALPLSPSKARVDDNRLAARFAAVCKIGTVAEGGGLLAAVTGAVRPAGLIQNKGYASNST